MACPYMNLEDKLNGSLDDQISELADPASQAGVNNLTITEGINYGTYLKLGKLLDAQTCLSVEKNGKPVHDEHLFIVTHQAFELWFKQVMYEIDSVREILNSEKVDEGRMLIITDRLNRVNVILKLLCEQFSILETMTPLDFLQFRTFLGSSSGFQSLQFRLLENSLGIRDKNRVRYNQQYYKDVFNDAESMRLLDKSVSEPSLLQLIERWLERTPGLGKDEFHFWNKYRAAVSGYLRNEFLVAAENEPDAEHRQIKLDEYKKTKEAFDSILEAEKYNTFIPRGERRISHKAFQGAMMIFLYRDEPRFHQPFQILTMLQDLDCHFTKWRYNHVMLVQRMIGSKVGSGGSSGYQYLRSTVSDRYKVFIDFFNLSTYIIPRSYIPPLSTRMKKTLSMMLKPDRSFNGGFSESSDENIAVNESDGEEDDLAADGAVGFTVGSVE